MRGISRGVVPTLRQCGLLAVLWIVIGLAVRSTHGHGHPLAGHAPQARVAESKPAAKRPARLAPPLERVVRPHGGRRRNPAGVT